MTTKEPNSIEFAHPRRKDKAVEDAEWIREMLLRGASGVLATSQEGRPYARPSLFVYHPEKGSIYFHGARQGRTPESVAADPRVCFCVSEMGRLLPASTAVEFGVEYASVIVFGRVSLVEDPQEAAEALQMFLDKYCPHLRPGEDYRPIAPDELDRTAVFRIEIEQWSGKKAEAPLDFVGAFTYRGG